MVAQQTTLTPLQATNSSAIILTLTLSKSIECWIENVPISTITTSVSVLDYLEDYNTH